MEDQRDQQTAPAPQPPPYAPELQSGVPPIGSESAAPNVGDRLSRLILRRVAYGLIVAGRLIRPRLGWVVLTLFLIGVIGFETAALLAPLFVAKIADGRSPPIPTSAAVESFLTGQSHYDADMMWESFSPRLQAALIDQGTSRDDLAAQMQTARSDGKRYTGFAYVGGVALPDDQKMYFYAVDVQLAQTNQKGTVGFTFTVDKSGKIIRIQN